ncbi:MAG: zinc ABC transporter substrate-binding protein [Pseudomonadota bacterium]
MPKTCSVLLTTVAFAVSLPIAAGAAERTKVVATFSILADFAERVGGDRVEVKSVIPRGVDPHVYRPTTADARALAAADLIVENGLEFEGWVDRLITASGSKGKRIVATKSIKTMAVQERDHDDHDDHGASKMAEKHDDHHDHGATKKAAKHDDHHDHGAAKKTAKQDDHHHHHHGESDPHAWLSPLNAVVYVGNVREGLCEVDAAGCETYRANANAYVQELRALDAAIREMFAEIPADKRRIIIPHDAFAYYAAAYDLKTFPLQGISTESEPSARDVAKLVRYARQSRIAAIFLEATSDPRLATQIARDSGAKIGGQLYPGTLSKSDGPAPNYVAMMRHNTTTITEALKGQD